MAEPRRLLSRLVSLLVPAACGILIGLWLSEDFRIEPSGPLPAVLWAGALLLAGLGLAVILHEVGHLAFGRLAGCRPRLFVIGPFSARWEGNHLRCEWNWHARMAGGLVSATPPLDGPVTLPVATLLIGGPVMNLLCTLAAGAVYLSMPPVGVPSWRLVAGMFAASSLLAAAMSLNPWRSVGLASDGLRLLRLWKGGPPAERDAALFALTGLIYAGVRPAQWPGGLLAQATALADGSADEAAGQILAFYQALDQGQGDRATAHLSRTLQLIDAQPPALRPAYYLEAAYGMAMLEGDADQAASYLARGAGGLAVEPYGRLRCEAAVLLAQGQPVQAMERVDQALVMLARKPKTGTDYMEESLLVEIQARARYAMDVR